MKSTPILLAKYGTDLSSRSTGSQVRDSVLAGLALDTDTISIDCAGLRTLSESFADELFGILVAVHGKEWFRLHIRVVGMSDSARSTILRAIDARLSRTPNPGMDSKHPPVEPP